MVISKSKNHVERTTLSEPRRRSKRSSIGLIDVVQDEHTRTYGRLGVRLTYMTTD